MFSVLLLVLSLVLLSGFILLVKILVSNARFTERFSVGRALQPAMLFGCLLSGCFAVCRIIYPLSEGNWEWKGSVSRWNLEEQIIMIWMIAMLLCIPVIAILGGWVIPRSTVKNLAKGDGFTPKRYRWAVISACGSVLIPWLVLVMVSKDSPSEMPLWDVKIYSWVLTASAALAVSVTVIHSEKARRSYRPDSTRGRAAAAAGFILGAGFFCAALYSLSRYIIGDYADCPCELEDHLLQGVGRMAVSAVIFVVVLFVSWICRLAGKVLSLYRDGK